ncbi:MAG: AcrR family transcriptional regulator [Cognaticolwellia sp.]|jgi:AcrR family transcriptional regulator
MSRLSTTARRAQLLSVGRMVFSSNPYERVVIDDLANAAGVSKGLLYHYFPDKRSFYVEVLRMVALDVLQVSEMTSEGSAAEAIGGAVDRFLTYVQENQAFYKALVRGSSGVDDGLEIVVESVRWTTVERVIERAGLQATPRLEALLYGWVGLIEFTVMNWLVRDDMDQATLKELILGALFQLLGLQ